MAGACSDSHARLVQFLGQSGAAYYHRDGTKQMFKLEFPIFQHLTSYPFYKIRTDLELLAQLNKVKIEGARPPFSICSIDVTGHLHEFNKAFTYYIATLPEYRATSAGSFALSDVVSQSLRLMQPHVARVVRLTKGERCSLSFPVRVGEELYLRTPHSRIFRRPLSVLMDVLFHVHKTHSKVQGKHRRRVLDALHPDYRSLLPEAEFLSMRVALINSSSAEMSTLQNS